MRASRTAAPRRGLRPCKRSTKSNSRAKIRTAWSEPQFFVDLVEGTWSRKPEIDGLISPALAQGWTLARIDPVLRAILRAGTYELLARGDVPARAAIDAYVDLSLEFDAGREVGFINSVLDRIAKGCRAPEMAERR
jgi:transcription antitermination protein NusB